MMTSRFGRPLVVAAVLLWAQAGNEPTCADSYCQELQCEEEADLRLLPIPDDEEVVAQEFVAQEFVAEEIDGVTKAARIPEEVLRSDPALKSVSALSPTSDFKPESPFGRLAATLYGQSAPLHFADSATQLQQQDPDTQVRIGRASRTLHDRSILRQPGEWWAETRRTGQGPPLYSPNMVVRGDFPNSIKIPGTLTSLSVGGFVELDGIFDFNPIGSTADFITSTIPLDGSTGRNTRFHARSSRLWIRTATPSDYGDVVSYLEWDFFRRREEDLIFPAPAFNLRQAYVQVGGWLAGQTWSTFMDPSIFPIIIDYDGPNSLVLLRPAMLRWNPELGECLSFAIAVESPASDVTLLDEFKPAQPAPDLASHVRWEDDWGHVQFAQIYRAIGARTMNAPTDEELVSGWGLNLSVIIKTWGKDYFFGEATGGKGIGRHVNDTNGGGLDAYQLENGELAALGTFDWLAGYSHFWHPDLLSTFVYAQTNFDSIPQQPALAYHSAKYILGNLIWTGGDGGFGIGVEFAYGELTANDGATGLAHRIQLGARYSF